MRGLTVRRSGRAVLDRVDLDVSGGEALAIIGPSGAGKTTLLRVLAGAVPPDSGDVRTLGVDVVSASRSERNGLRRRVGFVHQSHALVPSLRVVHNVAAGRLGRHGTLGGLRSVYFPSRHETEEIHAILERVGIADKLYARVDRLSGGERQRVAVARTLYQGARVALADEPVASVDPARARAVVELLRRVAHESDMTLVCSLHDVELAKACFPRIVGLRHGRVEFDVRRADGADTTALDEALVARLYSVET